MEQKASASSLEAHGVDVSVCTNLFGFYMAIDRSTCFLASTERRSKSRGGGVSSWPWSGSPGMVDMDMGVMGGPVAVVGLMRR